MNVEAHNRGLDAATARAEDVQRWVDEQHDLAFPKRKVEQPGGWRELCARDELAADIDKMGEKSQKRK